MPSEYQIDYNDFMKWFQIKYPDLFRKYASKIILAIDGTGLKVNSDDMSDNIHDILYDIQNEYYSLRK